MIHTASLVADVPGVNDNVPTFYAIAHDEQERGKAPLDEKKTDKPPRFLGCGKSGREGFLGPLGGKTDRREIASITGAAPLQSALGPAVYGAFGAAPG